MKRYVILMALALSLAMPTSAFALEVPSETIVQNLNGSQQVIKTYTISPEADPQELIEEPFTLEGYRYTFADIVKVENHVQDSHQQTETVTVETSKNDLGLILEKLAPTLDYDDGQYCGKLALDHTSIYTEAAGYTTRSYNVTETKTIGQLDRNDMSYVPATTVKDGRTLKLSNVEWQVTGTDLVGEALMPSSYQAVATYSGKVYYSAATGYITTADYVGEVTREGVESVTYQVTYLGTEAQSDSFTGQVISALASIWPYLLGGGGVAAMAILPGSFICSIESSRGSCSRTGKATKSRGTLTRNTAWWKTPMRSKTEITTQIAAPQSARHGPGSCPEFRPWYSRVSCWSTRRFCHCRIWGKICRTTRRSLFRWKCRRMCVLPIKMRKARCKGC